MGSRQTEREEEIKDEYLKTLQDLTVNSKVLIDVLTEVAHENREYASCIVECIEEQIKNVPSAQLKLLILFLIDSIIKHENIRQYYMHVFCRNIHKIFTKIYEMGDESVRGKLTRLRLTWNGILPVETLTALDNMVRTITPSWPGAPPPSVHVNPNVFARRVASTSNPAHVASTSNSAHVVNPTVINALVQNNVANLPAATNRASIEDLLQKQRELSELKQRKQELEQELKMLRPTSNAIKASKPAPAESSKPIERLTAIANGLFSQVDGLKSGTYVPSEVQQVRKTAVTLKNAVSNLLAQNEVPSNPKLAAFAKDTTLLKDLLTKLTETEKVLAETEKANQVVQTGKAVPAAKRKVIIAKNHPPLQPTVAAVAVPSSPQPTTVANVTRPPFSPRSWTKNPANNPFVYTKPVSNGNVGVLQTPQNPPQFRIAPVSSELISAAAKRARDPRLRPNRQQPVNQTGGDAVGASIAREVKTLPALSQVDSKNAKRNESPEKPVTAEVTKPKAEEPVKSKTTETPKPKNVPEPSKPKIAKDEPKESPSLPKTKDSPEKRKSKSSPEKREEQQRSEKRRNVDSPEKRKSETVKARLKNNVKSKVQELFEGVPNRREDTNKVKLSKEERNKRLNALADTVVGMDEHQQTFFINQLSKDSPRLGEMLKQHVQREKEANKKTPTPVVDGELMDITDDNGDCVIVSSPKEVTPPEEAIDVPVPSPEPPAQQDVDMEESSDSKDQSTESVEEPVVARSPSPHPQDVDIRPLIPPVLPVSVAYSLPVVSEAVVTPPITTSADSSSFGNPFGLGETKDIDYRQLFAFSLPPSIVSTTESADSGAVSDVIVSPLVKPESNDVDQTSAKEKEKPVVVKRKHADDVRKRSKRRRTSSPSSSSSSSSSSSDSDQKSPTDRRKHRYDSRNGDSDVEISDVKPAVLESDDKVVRVDGVEVHPPPAPLLSEDHKLDDLVVMPTSQMRASSKSPPPMFPFFGPSFVAGFANNFGMFASTTPEVPVANADVLKMIDRDPMKMINIDGIPRQIRHYGSTAVAFLNWDDPRQISFSSFDGTRRIIIDNKYCVPCSLNTPDVETLVYGKTHRFRLGAPTRELYVDGIGYECYFGGPPIKVRFDGHSHYIRLDGKPPKVDIGPQRLDLVAGKINIVINDQHTFPVFLDAKPQRIDVDGVPFVLMFIDALQRVLINEVPFKTEFGGLPQSFKFNNQVYYFRFTLLPVGIVPGAVNIFQMVMTKLPSPPPLPPSLQFPAMNPIGDDYPILPVPPLIPPIPSIPVSTVPVHESEPNPVVPVENSSDGDTKPPAVSNILGTLNLDELFQSLVASGIVSTNATSDSTTSTITTSSSSDNTSSAVSTGTIKPVDFRKPETLKQRQPALISMLYSGTQCGSCGMRFPEEQTLKYSEHLDWHFRLNRKGKDGARTIHSRKWYYSNNDWMKFQEMEDNSDRGQSWFDSHMATEYTEEVIEEVPCVSAGENSQMSFCELCRDKFEQFYNEDIDEWQLRNAIRVDEKIYHPICYQDYQEKADQSDVEEIVDLSEPIMVDDNDTSVAEELSEELSTTEIVDSTTNGDDEKPSSPEEETSFDADSVVVKKEKPDVPKSVPEKPKDTNGAANTDVSRPDEDQSEDSEDSDIEEVQLIEEPIEEIVIPDDVNDLEEPNLETLNAEDIIAAQQEVENSPSPEPAPVEEVVDDRIVDITHSTNTVSIDGNVELGDSYQAISGPTKIKINIAKNHLEEKVVSPKPEERKTQEDELSNDLIDNQQPPPPGEETITLVAADLKPKLKERKLTVYPPVTKGTEISGLCSIM